MASKTITPEQLKAKFDAEGKTFAAWAQEHGYSRFAVYQVLNGQSKGRRGKAHQIAVDLGLKAVV